MLFKKFLSIILGITVILSLTACQKDNVTENTAEHSSNAITEAASVKNADTRETGTVTHLIDSAETTVSDSTSVSAVIPSSWTKAEIVEAYKNAAEKSNKSVKSEQVITLKDISINNGQFEGAIDFVMPIMSKLLADNSTEKDGITGGYTNLTEADVRSAKVYASGENTVIEMVMNEQTDGAHGNALNGTVGHAISVVGDISVVADQLNERGLPIEISEKNTSIHYTNPVVKVLIDKDGNIIKGTWRYTVDIRLNNYKVGNSTVDSTSVVMDNVITVNGGF